MMKQLKILGISILYSFLMLSMNVVLADLPNPKGLATPTNQENPYPTVAEEEIKGQAIGPGVTKEGNKLKGILLLEKPETYKTSLDYTIALIQITINWVLGMLALVAVIYLLYCGFLVLTSGSDEKNSLNGKKGISTAAIALAGIGLSWLIISAIIRFINSMTKSGAS